MITIYVFTLPGCLACAMLKSSLKRENISFIEIDTTTNRDLWNSILDQGVSNLLPTVFVKSSDSEEGDLYTMKINFNDTQQMVEILKANYINK